MESLGHIPFYFPFLMCEILSAVSDVWALNHFCLMPGSNGNSPLMVFSPEATVVIVNEGTPLS